MKDSQVIRPPFLEVSTTSGCVVDCYFCPQAKAHEAHTARGGPRLMPLETFVTAINKMPGNTEVSFAGFAEPWLNNQCTSMAEYCHARRTQWEAYTTCVGMNLEDVARIDAAKPIRIKLHLPDEEGYAKIRVDDAYIAVVLKLAELPQVSVMTMGTLHKAFHRRFGKLKASFMHTRAGNVTVHRKAIRKTGPLRCRPGPKLDRNILLPNGDLVACCMAFNLQHIFGNLLTQTWDEIRAGEGLASLRRAMASENDDCLCRTCEVAESVNEKVKAC